MQFCVLLATPGVAVIQSSKVEGLDIIDAAKKFLKGNEDKRDNVDDTPLPKVEGLKFMGVGYNLLNGNPEGGQLSKGGVDPGLLVSRKIFKLTFNTNKASSDDKFRVADQVVFVHRSTCVNTFKHEVFSGAKSYQDKLKVDVEASGKYK